MSRNRPHEKKQKTEKYLLCIINSFKHLFVLTIVVQLIIEKIFKYENCFQEEFIKFKYLLSSRR